MNIHVLLMLQILEAGIVTVTVRLSHHDMKYTDE